MSTKPETTFILSVNRLLKGVYYEKTNNPFRSGIADSWYSGELGDLWVEYKYEPSLPKSKEYIPNVSPRQDKWLCGRFDEGRNVAVILGVPEGGIVMRSKTWMVPHTRPWLLDQVLSRPDLAKWIFSQVGKSPCKALSGRSLGSPP